MPYANLQKHRLATKILISVVLKVGVGWDYNFQRIFVSRDTILDILPVPMYFPCSPRQMHLNPIYSYKG
jgi:hypothetical protein